MTALVAPSFTTNVALANPSWPGPKSSSMIVNTAVAGAVSAAAPVGFNNARLTVSFPSTARSSLITTDTVCVATPGPKTSVLVSPT